MVYRKSKDGASVSILGFGCMRFACDESGKIDEKNLKEMVDLSIESGVNYFDTAAIYHDGLSEGAIGKALSGYPRDSFYLADKMSSWIIKDKSEAGLEEYFSKQLIKCGVEYFDFYLCHSMNSVYISDYKNGLIDFLVNKKKQGKIKRLGFSFHDTPEVLVEVLKLTDFDFVQIQLNYLDYLDQDAKTQYEILNKMGLPVIVMEPVRGGALSVLPDKAEKILNKCNANVSIASWAIRYAMSFEGVLTVLSGMSNISHVKDNLNTAINFKPLTMVERQSLDAAVGEIRNSANIPCTACKYCNECPSGIDIPAVFDVYNKSNTYGLIKQITEAYDKLADSVTSCINCNQCATHCPQNIKIPEMLKKVSQKFE